MIEQKGSGRIIITDSVRGLSSSEMTVSEGVYQIQRPLAEHIEDVGKGEKKTTFNGLLVIVFDEEARNKGSQNQIVEDQRHNRSDS